MILCIVNPTAGHGRTGKVFEKKRNVWQKQYPDWTFVTTKYAGHGTELSKEAVSDGAEMVVAMGGDGTVQEVARSLYGKRVPLGIIPTGTGNDYIKAFLDKKKVQEMERNPCLAIRHINAASVQQADVGLCNGSLFLNLGGCGFDTETILCTERVKNLGFRGFAAYLVALLACIFTHKDISARIIVDGEEREAKFMMLTISNGKYMGGGFLVSPDSVIDDGLFDCSLLHPISKIMIPILLPRFIKGEGKKLKPMETFRCKRITICCPDLYYEMDGEVFRGDMVTYEIAPEKLLVRV